MSGEAGMDYEKPEVVDFGDLLQLTAAQGSIGTEDGVGKTIQAGVGGIVSASIGLLP
jgi:hypothetical protein